MDEKWAKLESTTWVTYSDHSWWLTVSLLCHENRFQGLQNSMGSIIEAHRLGEWLERSSWNGGLLPDPVKFKQEFKSQVDLNSRKKVREGRTPVWVLLCFTIILYKIKAAHIYNNLNDIYLLNKWSTIFINRKQVIKRWLGWREGIYLSVTIFLWP